MRSPLLVLAACGSSAPPVVQHAAAPGVPAPRVVRGGMYGLTTAGMPAVADDGSLVVAAFRESDGERGLPNLTLIVKDRSDAEVARHVVLSLAEADGMLADAAGNNPRLDERVARANAWLDAEHARHRFAQMTVLEPDPAPHPADRRAATRGPLVVRWDANRLRIDDGPTSLVDRETPASWIPPNVTHGTDVCLRSPYLGGAAIDRDRRIAVVTISTVTESDRCLPAPDDHHVVVFQKTAERSARVSGNVVVARGMETRRPR